MYIGHHLPPENPEEEKEIFTSSGQGGSNRHRQAVPAPNKVCRVQTLSALRLSQQNDCASLLGVSKVTGKRDSSIIQITAADVNSLSAKKDNLSGDPSPKPKKLPCAVIAEEVCKKLLQTESAVAAQGSSGVGEGIGERAPPNETG